MPSVLIVVLNWNGIDDTEACLPSLFAQDYKNVSILVVDNGSTDDSVKRLATLTDMHENLTVIKNKTNKGFAGGVNTGIAYAIKHDYDYVALFNNDATADKKWLSSLVAMFKNKGVAASTGLLLRADGATIDSTGDYYSTWGMPFPRARGLKVKEAPDSGFVFGATGGATLYKTSLFKEIGLFDESFFAYYEDVDISFRAQLAGHKLYYSKEAIAYHKQGATSRKIPGFTVYQTFKNIPLLYIKNVPAGLLLPIGIRFLLSYTLMFGNAIKRGTGIYALKGWLASIYFFWKQSLWQRFTIQQNKKVSTAYLRSIIWHDIPPEQTGMRRFRQFFTGKY